MRTINKYYLFIVLIFFLSASNQMSAQIIPATVIADSGYNPVMTMDGNGNIHIVWQQNGCMYAVYDSLLKPVRTPYQVYTNQYTQTPYIIASDNSALIAFKVWQPMIPEANAYIYLKKSSSDGDTLGPFARCNFSIFGSDPQLVLLQDSTFLAAWVGFAEGTYSYPVIYGQIIRTTFGKPSRFSNDSSLTFIGPNTLLSDSDCNDGSGDRPKISSHISSSAFVVTYLNYPYNKNTLLGRIWHKEGNPLGHAFCISDSAATNSIWFHDVAMKNTGECIAVWSDVSDTLGNGSEYSTIYIRTISPDGTPSDSIRSINQHHADDLSKVSVGIDNDDSYVIVWEDDHHRITGQRFTSADELIGNNFYISDSSDPTYNGTATTILRNGKIYTVWSKGGSSEQTFANVLDFKNPVTTVEENDILPMDYSLSQNYPNPFNPTTTIKYSIPKESYVTVTVYDMLGRKAAMLVNETKRAGSYTVPFDASHLATGIYFYELSANGFTDVKKLTIVK